MVEGETGILSVHPRDFRPLYEPSKRRLTWPNGAVATLFNAVEPDQLRGPQQDLAWSDELAKWRYARETWDMLQFGLRLGDAPQQIITTTPKPVPVLKEIMASSDTVVTRGSTYANRANLAPSFFSQVVRKYEGTRLGRQELNAEILEEAEGALWSRELIERNRKPFTTDDELRETMKRIVVALDPAVSSDDDSAEHGIVVCGLGHDGHGYVLEDLSIRGTPDAISRRAIAAYDRWQADRVVGEVNNGGEWIGQTIATTAKAMHQEGQRKSPEVAYKSVHASRGKQTRAEPVSALDEQGRIHHVGSFPEMEDQMCEWEPLSGQRSPDRLDARVWGFTELMLSGDEAFEGGEGQFIFETKDIPHLHDLAKVFGLDIKGSRISVVWGAWDQAADIVYLYGEYVEERARLETWASAIRKRGRDVPGIFCLTARKRTQDQGERLVDRMVDEQLDIFTAEADAEASVDEINSRVGTQQLRVASNLTSWLSEYRAYRRDQKGQIVQENDGLMVATGLLLVSGLSIAMVGNATVEDAKTDWADQTRNRRTGY
jgi:phage terminase large subunit-like protein